jgi:hypothetical protein
MKTQPAKSPHIRKYLNPAKKLKIERMHWSEYTVDEKVLEEIRETNPRVCEVAF